jgi:hypothetical protein
VLGIERALDAVQAHVPAKAYRFAGKNMRRIEMDGACSDFAGMEHARGPNIG